MRISDWSSDVCSSDLLARSEHPARVAQDAQLQREAKTIVGAPALADMPEILIAEGIVPQQLTLIDRPVKQSLALSIGQGHATRHTCSFFFPRYVLSYQLGRASGWERVSQYV